MKILDLKIETQLKTGFSFLLLLVIVLGITSYIQTEKIHLQTETMYNHPISVRIAIGEISSNVLLMRLEIKDLILIEDSMIRQNILNKMAVSQLKVEKEMEVLKKWYLGPQKDIDNLSVEFTEWVTFRAESIRLLNAGKTEEAKKRHSHGGIGQEQALNVLSSLDKISIYAINKGNELYNNSKTLKDNLNRQLIFLIVLILLFSLLVGNSLLRNIRKPLNILTDASKRFSNGDMNARSSYELKNEFGILSESFNDLTESIQIKTDLDEKFAALAVLMLSEYDIKNFFRKTLNALAEHTGSQMAAIYLLNPDKKTYEHFESTGIDDNARQSFSADRFEGEFGSVLSTRKVHYMKNIPEDTRFVFHAVRGSMLPREIITIPILTNNRVVAIISIASINAYSKQSIQLISEIYSTLCARVEGIMAYHKMKELSEILVNQNRELEAQKSELAGQSAELMEQNTELEMQKRQLNEANRFKTDFLSNMSHELRTPLNSVIALSGVLNRKLAKKIPDEEYSYLEVIERNGKHLLTLINDVLDISRIEAGKEEVEIVKFSISDLISEVVSMIKPQADINNIELLFSTDDLNLNITSDPGKCRHVLQNLISNAVKFTEKGKVEVKSWEKDNELIISVSDTGIGISEENIKYIFDEFRQADSSTSRKFGGTGLGLAIAKKYADILGGTITVKSSLGKGSEFTVILPLTYESENKVIEQRRFSALKYNVKNNVSETAAKTILLVEDSEPAIIQIKDFLEEGGYKIMTARNGQEALEIISHCVPDAMILDLMMPGIDGFEVLKIIREQESTAHLPVLILTAKQITKEELKFLKSNNVYQLIQKGDINRNEFSKAVSGMVFTQPAETVKSKREINKIKGKPSVLIVEDNPDNMITAKALLSDKFNVFEAVNWEEGIAMTKKHKPDLVLMDIALPVTDGIKSFLAIRKDPALNHIPVIALTASAMINDREAILAYGFDAYIAKPIDENEFLKTINEVLYGK